MPCSHSQRLVRLRWSAFIVVGNAIMPGFAVMGWVAVRFIRETNCRYIHAD